MIRSSLMQLTSFRGVECHCSIPMYSICPLLAAAGHVKRHCLYQRVSYILKLPSVLRTSAPLFEKFTLLWDCTVYTTIISLLRAQSSTAFQPSVNTSKRSSPRKSKLQYAHHLSLSLSSDMYSTVHTALCATVQYCVGMPRVCRHNSSFWMTGQIQEQHPFLPRVLQCYNTSVYQP